MNTSKNFSLRLSLAATAATLLLAGCGLAETSAVAATEAAAAAEQVKEGKKLEKKVQDDVEAAQKVAADARANAEEANE